MSFLSIVLSSDLRTTLWITEFSLLSDISSALASDMSQSIYFSFFSLWRFGKIQSLQQITLEVRIFIGYAQLSFLILNKVDTLSKRTWLQQRMLWPNVTLLTNCKRYAKLNFDEYYIQLFLRFLSYLSLHEKREILRSRLDIWLNYSKGSK